MSKRINNNYTKEFKLKAIKMYLDESLSYYQVASNLNIKSKTQVMNWIKQLQTNGESSFDIETHGRATRGKNGKLKIKFNSLEEEVEYLRMEVELLKNYALYHRT
ncbi:transposase [Clostridium tertium]|uniref:transposase n=1 Tax=Clostridium tertium TaxID=1559 RepID=UPI003522C116